MSFIGSGLSSNPNIGPISGGAMYNAQGQKQITPKQNAPGSPGYQYPRTNNFWSNPAQQKGSVSNWDQRQNDQWNKNPGGLPPAFDLTQSPIYGQLQQLLGQLSNPRQQDEYFNNTIQKPTLRAYNEEILPAIQQRHWSPYGHRSSYTQALRRSGERLAEGLAGKRAEFQMNANQQSLASLLGLLGQHQQGQQSFFQQSPQTPLIEGPSNGWGKDALTQIASIVGSIIKAII